MEIIDLKKKVGEKTLTVFLLGVVTMSLYYVIWFLERYKVFNEIAGKEIISRNRIIGMAVLLGLDSIAIMFSEYSGPFLLIFFIVLIVSSFRIAKAIEEYYSKNYNSEVKLNKILLVVFNVLYVNYFINKLDKPGKEG